MFDIRKIQEQVIYEAVKGASDDEKAKEIVYGKDELARTEDNPTWVKSTMKRLENHFDNSTVKQIRMHCQCGYGMDEKLELLKELIESSSNIEEFGNSDKAKAAGLYCENGELYLQFHFCPCPMLEGVDRLETNTWCQCTTGYSKVLFEKAFGCKVDVELLKSIKVGDERCLMKIIPEGSIWE
jgi:predicted hydrocarbon binding protein